MLRNQRAWLWGSTLAVVALLTQVQVGQAGFFHLPPGQQLGGPAGNTIEVQYNDSSVLLGADGTTGLSTIANASTTYDEDIGLVKVSAITDTNGDPLLPNAVGLTGMISDLKLIEHTNSTGTVINDSTPGTGPIVLHPGDYLFFTEAGRNPLLTAPAGTGGAFVLSDTSGTTPFQTGGNTTLNNPQKLILGTGGFSVNASGTVTAGTPDNYNNGTGNAVNTSPGSILIAGSFVDISTFPAGTIIPPGGFTLPTFAMPAGTEFIEQVTSTGGLKAIGFLDVSGGNSEGQIVPTNFTPANELGAVPSNLPPSPLVGITFTSNTNFVAPTTNSYTQFNTSSSDPADYVGVVPEPSSLVLAMLGFGGLALARRRKLLGK